MIQSLLASWNLQRILRLLLGILALVQGFRTMENVMFFAGGFLIVTAIVNIGCGMNGCSVPVKGIQKEKKIQYEELDNK